jgi:hypothetical protein
MIGSLKVGNAAVVNVSAPISRLALVSPARELVHRFIIECLPRSYGDEVMVNVAYMRFLRFCDEQTPKVRPLLEREFWEHFEPLCGAVKIRFSRRGGRVYCVGARLAA